METGSVQFSPSTPNEDKRTNIPAIYCNGFDINLQAADVQLILKLGEEPVAAVVMTMPVIKSFADLTQQIVSAYEEATGAEIKSLSELKNLIATWASLRSEGA